MAGIENIAKDMLSENSVEVEFEGGELEIELEPEEGFEVEEEEYLPDDIPHFDNLVKYLSQEQLDEIGQKVIEGCESDKESRQEWVENIEVGIKSLGLKIEEVTQPFEGACGAYHPLILESAIKFQSKASLELFPPAGPAKTQIVGKETNEKQEKARRVKNYINYYITEKIPEYYTDGERMLFATALMGTTFRKIRYNPVKDRPSPEFLTYKNFIVADTAKSLEDQERYTHEMAMSANELIKAFANGEFIEPEDMALSPTDESVSTNVVTEIKGFTRPQDDRSQEYIILEQHVNINLPEPFSNPYDIADPYVVSVDKSSGKVLSVVRNWNEGDDELNREKLVWFIPWHFVPGMGFHSFGYIHLLGNLQITLTAILRSLVDSGQFANLQGGFKLKGVKISGKESDPIAPGEFRDVEATVDDLNKAIKGLPFKEPSQVLYNMLSFIEGRSQKFADSTEQVVNEATNYGPVGTTMALLEASTKFYSAIHKRLHKAQRQELKIITRILSDNVRNTNYEYEEDGVFEEDFNNEVSIIPVSDPNIPTAAHRMMIANAALDIALKVPELANKREAVRSALFAMGNIDVDKIIPPEEEVQPNDPISDIETATRGGPIKAFQGQDHESHTRIKTAWLEDPANGGSPVMRAITPVILANIKEHMMLNYREKLAGTVSNLNPEELQNIPTEDFVIAMAAEHIGKMNQALSDQMAGENPMDKIAEAEMLKATTEKEKLEHKKVIDFAESALDSQKLGLDIVKEQNRHTEKSRELQSALRGTDFKNGADLIKLALNNLSKRVDNNKKPK